MLVWRTSSKVLLSRSSATASRILSRSSSIVEDTFEDSIRIRHVRTQLAARLDAKTGGVYHVEHLVLDAVKSAKRLDVPRGAVLRLDVVGGPELRNGTMLARQAEDRFFHQNII